MELSTSIWLALISSFSQKVFEIKLPKENILKSFYMLDEIMRLNVAPTCFI